MPGGAIRYELVKRVEAHLEGADFEIDDCLANLDSRHRHQMDTLLNLEFQLFDEDVPIFAT